MPENMLGRHKKGSYNGEGDDFNNRRDTQAAVKPVSNKAEVARFFLFTCFAAQHWFPFECITRKMQWLFCFVFSGFNWGELPCHQISASPD